MSKSRQITLRVQSSEGTKRIDVNPSDTISQLFEEVFSAFELNSFGFGLYRQRNHKDEIISTRSRTVSGIGLSHGDMLYLAPLNGTQLWSTPSTSNTSNDLSQDSGPMDTTEVTSRSVTVSRSVPNVNVTEDEVDEQLRKLDGKIQRKRDEKL